MAKKSWPSSVAVVSQTSFPSTTGVDQPLYGIGVFHFTLLVSLQRSGNPAALVLAAPVACPSPCGPRNSGQSARAWIVGRIAEGRMKMLLMTEGQRASGWRRL